MLTFDSLPCYLPAGEGIGAIPIIRLHGGSKRTAASSRCRRFFPPGSYGSPPALAFRSFRRRRAVGVAESGSLVGGRWRGRRLLAGEAENGSWGMAGLRHGKPLRELGKAVGTLWRRRAGFQKACQRGLWAGVGRGERAG